MAKYFIYSRKSKSTRKGDSVGNQVEMAKRHIFSKDHAATEDDIAVFEDDGFSGKNTKRPDFIRMMERIRKGEPEYLVVYRLDRISRSVSDFCSILDLLQKKGIHFVSLNEDFDTKSPLGRVMITIASAFAQMEREIISERVADNMLELSKRGTWLGGKTPVGYVSKRIASDPERGILKEHSVLEADEESMPLVQEIFQIYDQTRVIRSVRTTLYERHKIHMADSRIKSILTNPVYCAADAEAYDYFYREDATLIRDRSEYDGSCGIMPYNRHDNNGRIRRSMSEWIIAIGSHKPVVDGRRFVTIQKSLMQNALDHPRDQSARNSYALLTGLLVCGKCGKKMYTQPQNSGRGKSDRTRFTYICETRKTYGVSACDCKSVSGTRLDDFVLQKICDMFDERSDVARQLEEIRIRKNTRRSAKDIKASIEREIEQKNRRISSLIDDMADMEKGSPARKSLLARIDQMSAEVAELERKAGEIGGVIEEVNVDADCYEYIEQCLTHVANACKTMTVAQQRDCLCQAIDKVVWDGEHADIFIYGGE